MHFRLPRRLLLTGVVSLLFTADVFAASVVTVTVSSGDSAQFLQRARVELQPGGREAFTDQFGVAEFTDVAAGDYRAKISYVGFSDQDAAVHVGDSGRFSVPVVFTSGEAVKLAQFVVTSEREGNAAALVRQKNAPNVENIIAMDALGVLANDNPAELLTRLAGVYSLPSTEGNYDRPVIRGMPGELNSTMVDGGQLAPPFSLTRGAIYTNITASNFDEIQVSKALTPSMPADSISGRVNFKTKTALSLKTKRDLSLRLGGKWSPDFFDYTPRREAPAVVPNLSVSYREVFDLFGDTHNFGLAANGVYNENVTQRTRTISRLDTGAPAPRFTERFQRYDGIQDRRLRTGNLRLDYKLSPDSRFFFNVMRSVQEQRTGRPDHYQVDYLANITSAGRAFATAVNAAGAPTAGGNIKAGSTEAVTEVLPSSRTTFVATTSPFEADDQTNYYQFGGEHRRGGWRFDYLLGYSRAERNSGGRHEYDAGRNFAATVANIGWIVDKTQGADFPAFRQTAGPSILDPRNYTGANINQSSGLSANDATSGELNVKRDVRLGERTVQVSGGALFKQQSFATDTTTRTFTYLGPDGVIGTNATTRVNDDDLTRFASSPRLDPRLGLGGVPAFDPAKYSVSLDTQPQQWRADPYGEVSSQRANYARIREDIDAAYLMGDTRLGRLGVLAGVRWEKTETQSRGYLKQANLPTIADPVARVNGEYGTAPRVRRGSYDDFFPSVHFRYNITPDLLARASWSTSIGRPSLADLVPTLTVDDANRIVTIDNPALRPQFADSYDLSLEYYVKPIGLISVGLFRKDLSDFVFKRDLGGIDPGTNNGFGGLYAGYDLMSNGNGGRGKVQGVELSYLQQLTFLPGALRGLTVLANYTHLTAKGDYGQDSGGFGGLVGFVPDTANLRTTYNYRRFSGYVQWSYVGRTLAGFNALPYLETDTLERRLVNAGVSWKFPRNLEFFFDVTNLLDEPQRSAQHVTGTRISTIYNGPFVSFGISGRF